jgi:hypothetical protein
MWSSQTTFWMGADKDVVITNNILDGADKDVVITNNILDGCRQGCGPRKHHGNCAGAALLNGDE